MVTWTKAEAASEQLDASILMLANKQYIAAHTLVSAAAELATACARALGRRTNAMVLDELVERLTPHLVGEFRKAMKKPQNFAKHADRDPTDTIDVNPEFTTATLYQAIIDLGVAFEKLTFRQLIFRTWFIARYWNHWPVEQREAFSPALTVFGEIASCSLDQALDVLQAKIEELDAEDLRARFASRVPKMEINWTSGVWDPKI